MATPPSTLVILSDLPATDQSRKVRFVGCVASYSTNDGTLELRSPVPLQPSECVQDGPHVPIPNTHVARPSSYAGTEVSHPQAQEVVVQLDTALVLDTASKHLFEPYTWVNVIGYVVGHKRLNRKHNPEGQYMEHIIRVQALMMNDAAGHSTTEAGSGTGDGHLTNLRGAVAPVSKQETGRSLIEDTASDEGVATSKNGQHISLSADSDNTTSRALSDYEKAVRARSQAMELMRNARNQ